MSDCGETAFFWESRTWTPAKEKKKKNSRKDKLQLKNEVKTNNNNQKKKKKKKHKSSKFIEAVTEKMEKKKEKKKKKKRLALGLDDCTTFTQGTPAHAQPPVQMETLNPQCVNTPKHDEDCKKKIKGKKTVAFDSLPGYIWTKQPKIVSSNKNSPKESIVQKKAMRHNEICLQDKETSYNQAQTHVNESQCTNEDINSQDLFITQKTFRSVSSEPSSGEASGRAVNLSPEMFKPLDTLHTSVEWYKQHLEGSYKCPHFQHHRITSEHTQNLKTVHVLASKKEEEEDRLNNAHQNLKKVSFHVGKPLNGNSSLDAAKSMKHNYILSDQPLSRVTVESTSTQTENFFSSELCSYLNFCQRRRVNVQTQDLKPLDLSLPQQARRELGICFSVTKLSSPGDNKGNKHQEPNLHPYCDFDMKDVEVKLESELNNVDKTTSSEDEPPCHTGKLERTKGLPLNNAEKSASKFKASDEAERLECVDVKAIQMRLNESFFFKTREGKSHRPESPLMKLDQGREVKSRKVI